MSVFSLNVAKDNPVSLQDLQQACEALGVTIKDHERNDYLNLLAVYHESMVKLLAMEGNRKSFTSIIYLASFLTT